MADVLGLYGKMQGMKDGDVQRLAVAVNAYGQSLWMGYPKHIEKCRGKRKG